MTTIQLSVTNEDLHRVYTVILYYIDLIDVTYLNHFCGLYKFCIYLNGSVSMNPLYVLVSSTIPVFMYKYMSVLSLCVGGYGYVMNNAAKDITKQKSMWTLLHIWLRKTFSNDYVHIVLAFFIAAVNSLINM